MGFTKNWVSHAIWCSWQLVSFGCSVLQHRVFSGTQNWFWSATWLSSCQHHTFGGGGVARILCGLLMVTLLFQQLLFFLMWFPYPWAMLSMVTFASVLPKNVIWPQTLVGNSQSPLSHRTPTTSSHLGHLQFSARSVTTLFWKALFYRDDRNGNYIQMGINSWCFNKTPIPAFLGNSVSFRFIQDLLFYHRCRFGSSFIQLFVTWLFTKAFSCKKSIFSCHEFCFQLSTCCFPNPPPGWSAPSGPTKAVSWLHIMCQVHLMPLPSISRGFNQSYLQNWSLYRGQQQHKELLTATATTLWFKDLRSTI